MFVRLLIILFLGQAYDVDAKCPGALELIHLSSPDQLENCAQMLSNNKDISEVCNCNENRLKLFVKKKTRKRILKKTPASLKKFNRNYLSKKMEGFYFSFMSDIAQSHGLVEFSDGGKEMAMACNSEKLLSISKGCGEQERAEIIKVYDKIKNEIKILNSGRPYPGEDKCSSSIPACLFKEKRLVNSKKLKPQCVDEKQSLMLQARVVESQYEKIIKVLLKNKSKIENGVNPLKLLSGLRGVSADSHSLLRSYLQNQKSTAILLKKLEEHPPESAAAFRALLSDSELIQSYQAKMVNRCHQFYQMVEKGMCNQETYTFAPDYMRQRFTDSEQEQLDATDVMHELVHMCEKSKQKHDFNFLDMAKNLTTTMHLGLQTTNPKTWSVYQDRAKDTNESTNKNSKKLTFCNLIKNKNDNKDALELAYSEKCRTKKIQAKKPCRMLSAYIHTLEDESLSLAFHKPVPDRSVASENSKLDTSAPTEYLSVIFAGNPATKTFTAKTSRFVQDREVSSGDTVQVTEAQNSPSSIDKSHASIRDEIRKQELLQNIETTNRNKVIPQTNDFPVAVDNNDYQNQAATGVSQSSNFNTSTKNDGIEHVNKKLQDYFQDVTRSLQGKDSKIASIDKSLNRLTDFVNEKARDKTLSKNDVDAIAEYFESETTEQEDTELSEGESHDSGHDEEVSHYDSFASDFDSSENKRAYRPGKARRSIASIAPISKNTNARFKSKDLIIEEGSNNLQLKDSSNSLLSELILKGGDGDELTVGTLLTELPDDERKKILDYLKSKDVFLFSHMLLGDDGKMRKVSYKIERQSAVSGQGELVVTPVGDQKQLGERLKDKIKAAFMTASVRDLDLDLSSFKL